MPGKEDAMQHTAEQIGMAALNLPRPARARILATLVASLAADPEVDRAWVEDIRLRIARLVMEPKH